MLVIELTGQADSWAVDVLILALAWAVARLTK